MTRSVLEQLYACEINGPIARFYDAGFTARLGDEMNGIEAERTLPNQAEAEAWLDAPRAELPQPANQRMGSHLRA